MIVLVEGIDRVGKTSLARRLEASGFIYLKDEFVLGSNFVENFDDYSVGKCDSFVALVKQFDREGKDIVIDRLHITELVYGNELRKGLVNESACWYLDMVLANLGAYLVHVKPSDIDLSNKLSGEVQNKRASMFDFYIKMSSMTKIETTYENIENTVQYLLSKTTAYDFYFASPFFNDEQIEREERMIAHLRNLGFLVFSPKEACHLEATAGIEARHNTFNMNIEAIRRSKAVFAVTDGKDVGTIWEAGYAFGINKPVIYFAETLGTNKFNLMLAQSGRDVYLKQEEVTYNSLIDSLCGVVRDYRGDIE